MVELTIQFTEIINQQMKHFEIYNQKIILWGMDIIKLELFIMITNNQQIQHKEMIIMNIWVLVNVPQQWHI